MIYPIKTKPVFKQYLWGGSNLKTKFGKSIPDDFAAESWEISCHDDGLSFVANGEYEGKTLKDVIFSDKEKMLGHCNADSFPLLVKILDASDKLSVQVHPDDEYASKHENGERGKTEMWYVINAKPGAHLVYGLKQGTTKEDFSDAVKNNTLENILNYVPVKKGDSFFIPSGTVHAICEGLLIAEIQQSSNTTYRVYDYNRVGKDGKTRELHVDKAKDVINYSFSPNNNTIREEKYNWGSSKELCSCEFFTVVKYIVADKCEIQAKKNKFEMLVFTEGSGYIGYDGMKYEFRSGDSFFIPAAIDKYTICGNCEFLRSFE